MLESAISDVFHPYEEDDECNVSSRPKFDEMLNQLSAHTGLFSRATFQNIYGCHVLVDKGYDCDSYRQTLSSQNNTSVILGRKNRKVPIVYSVL
jgi:hypothetical protein